MKTAWQAALAVGIVSLVMGIIEHFVTIGGPPGIFQVIATPDAFMGFAVAMFLLALVFQVGLLLERMEGKTETDQPPSDEE